MPSRAARRVSRYAWAVVCVGVTATVVWLGPDVLKRDALGLVFLVAVFASTVLGGFGAGFAAILLSLLAVYLFFAFGNVWGTVTFIFVSAVVVWMVGRRRVAEQERRASEKRFRDLAESLPSLVWAADGDGKLAYYNGRAVAFTGIPLQRLVAGEWVESVHPDDRENARAAWVRSVQTGTEYREEFRVREGATGEYVWHVSRAVPVRDARGVVTAWYGTATDIHARKKAEEALQELNQTLEERVARRTAQLEQSREALRQSERLAAIGQMVTGLSHESRNALQRSLACIELLEKRVREQPNLHHLVSEVRQANVDLLRVYEGVQDYARPIQLSRARTDVATVWRAAWDKLMARRGRDAVLVEDCSGVRRECDVDTLLLEQVFRNLLENALAACADPVEIRIACSSISTPDGPMLRVSVRDNGPGLPAEMRSRVFEPFFTTKTRGTGLGLAIVRRIVEAHGGSATLAAATDCGLEILVDLPVSTASES